MKAISLNESKNNIEKRHLITLVLLATLLHLPPYNPNTINCLSNMIILYIILSNRLTTPNFRLALKLLNRFARCFYFLDYTVLLYWSHQRKLVDWFLLKYIVVLMELTEKSKKKSYFSLRQLSYFSSRIDNNVNILKVKAGSAAERAALKEHSLL